jgi:hypothetical protein
MIKQFAFKLFIKAGPPVARIYKYIANIIDG